jgi:hypothetical protein
VATIFAGQYGQFRTPEMGHWQNGDLATSIAFSSLFGLWVSRNGTVYFSDQLVSIIGAIDPATNQVTWFAGTWDDYGAEVFLARDDSINALQMNGPATLGKIYPGMLWGNDQLNRLYVSDTAHDAVRVVSGRRKMVVEDQLYRNYSLRGNI